MGSYKELIVWQKSFSLSTSVYEVTGKFPLTEQFGLASQMRRCSVSIVSNIAEGHSRNSTKEFITFLRIALGSTSELETQLLLSKELGFISQKDFEKINPLLSEIEKILHSLISSLKRKVREKEKENSTTK